MESRDIFAASFGEPASNASSRSVSPVRLRPGSSDGGESPRRVLLELRRAGSSTSSVGLR